jgi:hypothetical protein
MVIAVKKISEKVKGHFDFLPRLRDKREKGKKEGFSNL